MLLSRSIRARQLGDSYIEISKYVRFQLRQRQLGSANATKASVLPVRQSSTTSAQDPERQLDKRPGHLTQDVGANASSGKPELAGRDYACLRRFQGSCKRFKHLGSFDLAADGTGLSQHEITTWDSLAKTEIPTHSSDTTNEPNLVRICGYITSQRSAGKFEFFQLVDPGLELAVQVICSKQKLEQNVQSEADHGRRDTPEEVFNLAKDIRGHTPVQVIGSVVQRAAPPKKKGQTRSSQQLDVQNGNTLEKLDPFVGQINLFSHIEIQADSIIPLNTFPTDLVAKCDTVFPPELRHLQFRTDNELRSRIRLRSKVAAKVREGMLDKDFDEIETPLLFKSTPEGAREFIVPTRKKGMAYALPQSPQQYKQVLMASGIPRYFQFAKCFRDEDLRADRQPEFTQVCLCQLHANNLLMELLARFGDVVCRRRAGDVGRGRYRPQLRLA
jgi:lysyl-tRNA synthetase class II